MIDRPIRPLFPEGFRNDTQVIAVVLSADTENDPYVLAINGAGAALVVSDIPFPHFVGAVRVGQLDGKFIINPTYKEIEEGKLNITVVGTPEGIVMIEAGAREVTEETVVDAIEFAHGEIKKICSAIRSLSELVDTKKREVNPVEFEQSYYDGLKGKVGDGLSDSLNTTKHPKSESYQLGDEIKKELVAQIGEDDDVARKRLSHYYEILRDRLFREQVTKDRRRPDARAFDQIRPIIMEGGVWH